MQRTKKRPDSMPGFQIGTSYLLVIFIILCLVIFAALALSSALRDQSYSQAPVSYTNLTLPTTPSV